jgi:nitrite reductase (NO-forming)
VIRFISRRPTQVALYAVGTGLALLLAACTVGQRSSEFSEAGTPSSGEITVTASDFKLEPSSFTLAAGRPVQLTFVNKGNIEHDWSAVGLAAKDVSVVSLPSKLSAGMAAKVHDLAAQGIPHPAAAPGQRMVISFTPTPPGRFTVICEVPGHKEAGMTATVIVQDAGGSVAAVSKGDSSESPAREAAPASATPIAAPRLPQAQIAPALGVGAPQLVRAEIETKEVLGYLDDGTAYPYWTFGGTVPGPMIRARQGDTVEVTLKNATDSTATHSIDLHAVTGPGGGSTVTQVAPGERATFRFQALQPGVYVYHCATPPVAHHLANGMYGLIVVEPPEGLAAVDREFYVMQGEMYLAGNRGDTGERQFSMEKMLDERPDYVVFNGAVGSLTEDRALRANVGERVRIFFGVGGPNVTSSFHVIGEIFDAVAPEGAAEWAHNVQTTLVPAGGATIVEFTVDVPGDYVLVDHSLGRVSKGAAATLHVQGAGNPDIFEPVSRPDQTTMASMAH